MAFRSRPKPKRRGWFFCTKQPHHYTWLIALVLAAIGFIGTRTPIAHVTPNAFWLMLAAYVLLALGTVIDGL